MSLALTEIKACRSCGSADIPVALDLGDFYLSDFTDWADGHTDKAPLVLVRCEACTLVQLRHTVDRDRLYRQYWYRSGTNPSMVSALRDVVRDATARVSLRPGDVVLDIGANDGTLLRMFRESAPEAILMAYEPATNLWPDIVGTDGPWAARGVRLSGGYFPTMIQGKPLGMEPGAKIITSIACFYDVHNPNDFVEGIKKSLAPDGVWINQLAYLPATLEANNFGDIVHEHLTYWTITSFAALLKRHGLALENWSFNDVNGGSVRFIVKHDVGQADLTSGYADTDGMRALTEFGQRIQNQRTDVRHLLQTMKRDHVLILGYGASTKGNTYLQYWGIGPDLLPTIADRNPEKWGKYTPTGQRVISEQEMREAQPDYLLVLPFHFLDSFVEREHEWLRQGGLFVVPFPTVRLIGESGELLGQLRETYSKGGDPDPDVFKEATLPDLRPAV